MAILGQRLDLRHSQALVMTPQLQQAIKLLQLSNLELNAFVEEQLRDNPLLERAEGDELQPLPHEAPVGDDGGSADPPPADTLDAIREEGRIGERAAELDADYTNVWDGGDERAVLGQAAWGSGGDPSFDDPDGGLEGRLADQPSLRQHLERQLELEIAGPAERLIGLQLIDRLDEAGYLRADLGEVAAELGCPAEAVEAVLARLQGFDPPGIFARSLKECLALQLRDRNRLDPAMAALLENLDLLARRDFAALRGICGVDGEDLADMLRELRTLDPKPGLAFDRAPVETLVPDIVMRPHPEGGWSVELNTDALPRVLVNMRYYARVRGGLKAKEAREYLTGQLNAANWLVKALHQRATTILKVASEIVRQQDGFFAHGVSHLRPLTLRDIAETIGMHESTVSRVTSNKYMHTPRGIFELKYFFTAAIQSVGGGEAHSAEAVRWRVKALIDAESPDQILSDDRLVEILRGEGIEIARRTVAKYREALRIPSSLQRRREKAPAGWADG